MTDLKALKIANADRWDKAKITRNFSASASRLVSAKARYLNVSNSTGVPWFVIAVIHEREASQRWDTQLGQGDPLHAVSVHVPAGRGPFSTWEEGAIDALVNCAPRAAANTDWSAGGALTLLERYNGLGYANGPVDKRTGIHYPPQASPYVWAGTDQYSKGKYPRDGEFDPHMIDSQLGCAGLLMEMMALDSSITFAGTKPVPIPPPIPPKPVPPQPSIWAAFLMILASIFKRK